MYNIFMQSQYFKMAKVLIINNAKNQYIYKT